MPTPISTKSTAKPKRKIPDYLVYEVMDGEPIYYRGYESVLNKTKTVEQIIGCSSLQAELIDYLLSVLYQFIDRKNIGFTPMKLATTSIQKITSRTTLPFSTKLY